MFQKMINQAFGNLENNNSDNAGKLNHQQRNEKGKRCSVDKSEYSFEDIAEYLLEREKEKNVA